MWDWGSCGSEAGSLIPNCTFIPLELRIYGKPYGWLSIPFSELGTVRAATLGEVVQVNAFVRAPGAGCHTQERPRTWYHSYRGTHEHPQSAEPLKGPEGHTTLAKVDSELVSSG